MKLGLGFIGEFRVSFDTNVYMAAGRHGGYRDNEFRGVRLSLRFHGGSLVTPRGITKELGLRIGILIGIEFMTGVVEIGVG